MKALRRAPRADLAIIALTCAVVALTVIVAYGSPAAPPLPYASSSAAPDGTLSLFRWLQFLGYQPRRSDGGLFRPGDPRALIVLQPRRAYSTAERAELHRWVRAGGTLILLQDGGETSLAASFGVTIAPLSSLDGVALPATSARAATVVPVQPLLDDPPLGHLSVPVAASISAAPRVVPVLEAGTLTNPAAVVLAVEPLGRGAVYVGTIPSVVTNGAIAAGANRALIANLLARLPRGAAIGFDDVHLTPNVSSQAGAATTLNDAIVSSGWGRALLYGLALVAAYLVLTGRRMGRPLRSVPERGRSLAEYVISMAAIFRRAGLRTRSLALWQSDLRRRLAGPGGIRGRSDAEIVGEAARRHTFSASEEREALALLAPRDGLSETQLVELCGRIDALARRSGADASHVA